MEYGEKKWEKRERKAMFVFANLGHFYNGIPPPLISEYASDTSSLLCLFLVSGFLEEASNDLKADPFSQVYPSLEM